MQQEHHGIGFLSCCPMRSEPSDSSEMVNQLLLGEHYRVLEFKTKWIRIKLAHDGYEGWLDRLQHRPIDEATYMQLDETKALIAGDPIQVLTSDDPEWCPFVLQGSLLPFYKDHLFMLGAQRVHFQGTAVEGQVQRDVLVERAYSYLNAPYLWGGRSPLGIDCSGFVQMVYRFAGVNMLRDASQQAQRGTTLSFIEECQPGDLAFFDNAEGRITHVGMVLNEGKIIHASGHVRIDDLDHSGIFNSERNTHTHNLRLLKSYLP